MDARDEEWRDAVARQEATERLARLGSWTWRPAPGGMHWSAGLYRLLGRAPERHPPGYEALVNAVHPDDKGLFLLQLETALKRKTRLSLDHRIVLPDGREREVHTEAERVFRGGEEAWVATMQERPAAVTEPLRRLVEAMPDVYWLRTLDFGETLYVSRSYEHLWGRSPDELWRDPRAFMKSVVPEDLPRLGRSLECHAQGCAYEVEYRIRHPRGLVRWVRERGYPVRDPQGRLVAMAAVAVDITVWKFDDMELRESARRTGERLQGLGQQLQHLQGVLDALPVAILRFHEPDGARYVNQAARRLLGWSAEEMAAGDFLAAAFPAEEERRRFLDHLRRALPGWRDFPTRHRSGEQREFAWAFARTADGSGLAFGIDVQERRDMERRLRESEETLNRTMAELRTSQRREIQVEKLTALGTLAAGVAHELNNPMMAVMNYVDYAGRVAHSDEAARTLAKALGELERMRDLLQNMLAFALPSREPTTQVALRHVVENALNLMRPEFARRGIVVAVDVGEGLPQVPAREGQLQQVVVNLLMNARDALEKAPEKRITIRGARRGELVELQMEDSGPGIPEGIRDQIFDPFFTTKPPGRGTGLGLSVSRSIMLDLGGDLILQGGNEGGAVFTLSFPVAGGAGRG